MCCTRQANLPSGPSNGARDEISESPSRPRTAPPADTPCRGSSPLRLPISWRHPVGDATVHPVHSRDARRAARCPSAACGLELCPKFCQTSWSAMTLVRSARVLRGRSQEGQRDRTLRFRLFMPRVAQFRRSPPVRWSQDCVDCSMPQSSGLRAFLHSGRLRKDLLDGRCLFGMEGLW